jgi:hypothetical protein
MPLRQARGDEIHLLLWHYLCIACEVYDSTAAVELTASSLRSINLVSSRDCFQVAEASASIATSSSEQGFHSCCSDDSEDGDGEDVLRRST